MKDRRKYIENLFKIPNKNGTVVPFELNEIQSKFYENYTGRDIILKARQMGMSSLILAMWLVDCIYHDNLNAVIVSHEADATRRLLDRAEFYLESLPDEVDVPLETSSRNEFKFEETGSRFYIGTAGSKAFGRGDTIHRAHLSELAWWADASILTGLFQSIPDSGEIVIESTANGMGNDYHKRWVKAKNGEGRFTPHFFSWKDFDEYRADTKADNLTPKEQQLMAKHGLDRYQMQWRRYKIAEFTKDEDTGLSPEQQFNQEYPVTPNDAFISTGLNAFDTERLLGYKKKKPKSGKFLTVGGNVQFGGDENGFWKIFKHPEDDHFYSMGVDTAKGSKKGNFSTAVILDNDTLEQVAEFRGKLDTDIFIDEIKKAGEYYNMAYICPEVNYLGDELIRGLRDDYSNLYYRNKATNSPKPGWIATKDNKNGVIQTLQAYIRRHDVILKSEALISECLSFIRDEHGKYHAAEGEHDDLVMALALALKAYNDKTITSDSVEKQGRRGRGGRGRRNNRKKQSKTFDDSFSSASL